MKKKLLALCLLLSLVLLLCGCDGLEELRSQRAEYAWKDVVHQGVTYKKLPVCPALNPEMDYDRPVYVVEPDVPLLLIKMEADAQFYQSKDSNFLMHYSSEVVYCREDMYEELNSTIAKGWEYTKVYYDYTVFNPEDPWDYEEKRYHFTQEQINALEILTTNVEPQKLGDGLSLDTDWQINIYESSEDGFFNRYSGRIAAVGSSYYLIIQDHQLNEQAFKVPDGMVSTFDDIMEAYRTAYETPEVDEET